jgi:hypothetical protein
MGDLTERLPTTPAPASLRAAGTSGVVTIRNDLWPRAGDLDNPRRWQQEAQFTWPSCRPLVVGAQGCATFVHSDVEKGYDPGSRSVVDNLRPIQLEAQLECTLPITAEPPGPEGIEGGQASLVAETAAALERGLIPQVAEELWSGAVARNAIDEGFDTYDNNRWLTRPDYGDVVPGTDLVVINEDTDPVPLAGAIGLLEQYLACCSDVGRGVIHVPPTVVPPLASLGNMLNQGATTGGARFSPSGHVLVAECGYTGYGPDGDDGPTLPADGVMWLYATGPLFIHYSTMTPIGTIEEVMALFAQYNNTVALAPAEAVYIWGCCHAAVAVNVEPFGLTLNPGS